MYKSLHLRIDVTDQFLSSQVQGMIFAGHASSATVLMNTLYELALNQNIQVKLRKEIENVCIKSEKLQYEMINEMPYLDAICKGTCDYC